MKLTKEQWFGIARVLLPAVAGILTVFGIADHGMIDQLAKLIDLLGGTTAAVGGTVGLVGAVGLAIKSKAREDERIATAIEAPTHSTVEQVKKAVATGATVRRVQDGA